MKATFHEQKLLSAKECDEVIELFGEDHGHGGVYEEGEDYISKRTSIVTLPDAILAKVKGLVDDVNEKNWGYRGEYAAEHELYRYEPGDFFDWHMDLGDGALANRKVTTLIQLTSPSEYEGGRLELFGNDHHTASVRRGTILVYPSYIMHRVTEVTSGIRYSLGGEVLGPPFR